MRLRLTDLNDAQLPLPNLDNDYDILQSKFLFSTLAQILGRITKFVSSHPESFDIYMRMNIVRTLTLLAVTFDEEEAAKHIYFTSNNEAYTLSIEAKMEEADFLMVSADWLYMSGKITEGEKNFLYSLSRVSSNALRKWNKNNQSEG